LPKIGLAVADFRMAHYPAKETVKSGFS